MGILLQANLREGPGALRELAGGSRRRGISASIIIVISRSYDNQPCYLFLVLIKLYVCRIVLTFGVCLLKYLLRSYAKLDGLLT